MGTGSRNRLPLSGKVLELAAFHGLADDSVNESLLGLELHEPQDMRLFDGGGLACRGFAGAGPATTTSCDTVGEAIVGRFALSLPVNDSCVFVHILLFRNPLTVRGVTLYDGYYTRTA